MEFGFSFLARIYRSPFETWDAVCLAALALVEDAPSRADALSQITEELRDYTATEAVDYIKSHAGDSTSVRCPEGTINLLADDWFCKHTKGRCPIDAVLDRSNLKASLSHCVAPEKVQAGIPAALTDGYAGLHHVSGRYLCPLCGSRERTRYRASSYRYPFELQHLVDVLGLANDEIDRNDLRRQVVLNGINLGVMSSAICARCLQGVVEKINPDLAAELEIVDLVIDL